MINIENKYNIGDKVFIVDIITNILTTKEKIIRETYIKSINVLVWSGGKITLSYSVIHDGGGGLNFYEKPEGHCFNTIYDSYCEAKEQLMRYENDPN